MPARKSKNSIKPFIQRLSPGPLHGLSFSKWVSAITQEALSLPSFLLSVLFVSGIWFAETPFRYVWLLFSVGLVAAMKQKTNWQVLPSQKWIWWSWLSWTVISLLATVTSIQLPLSLQALALPIAGGITLWWWSGIAHQWQWRNRVVTIVAWSTLFLAIISVYLLFFNPDLATHLPSLNYLYPKFGHSRLAGLLLLILPLVWSNALQRGSVAKNVPSWLAIALTVALGLTMSRLAIILGALQLGWLLWLYRSQLQLTQLRTIIITLAVFLFFTLGLKQWLLFSGTEQWLCEREIISGGLCLDQHQELRWFYWEQAKEVVRHYPLLGSGPGTFSVAARPFVQFLGMNTAFAHNWLLAAMAETGWLGLISYVALIGSLFSVVWRQRRSVWGQAILVSFIGMLILAIVDFDNQLLAVWLLLLSLIGLSFRQSEPSHQPEFVGWKILRFALTSFLVVLGFITGWSSWQVSEGKVTEVLQVWPYATVSPATITLENLPADVQQKLRHIYRYDPDYLVLFSTTSDSLEQFKVRQQIAELDPWRGVLANQLADYREQDIPTALEAAEKYWQRVHRAQQAGWVLTGDTRARLADEFYELARRLSADQQWQASGEWLRRAQQLDVWVLSRSKPFITENAVNSTMVDFIRPLATLPRQYYGDNQALYTTVFNQIMVTKTRQLNADIDEAVRQTLAFESGRGGINSDEYRRRLIIAQENLLELGSLALTALPTEDERSETMLNELVALLLRLAEYGSDQEIYHTARLYQTALALRPWAMNGRKWWFELRELEARDKQEVYRFLDVWTDWSGDGIGHNPQVFAALIAQGEKFASQDNDQLRKVIYGRLQEKLKQSNATENK